MSGFQILEDEERSVAASRYRLVFDDATVEADYQRFWTQGSYGFTCFAVTMWVCYHGLLVVQEAATPGWLHPASLLAHSAGLAINLAMAPLVFSAWVAHRQRTLWEPTTLPNTKLALHRSEVRRAAWTELLLTYVEGLNNVFLAFAVPLRMARNCRNQHPGDTGCKFQQQGAFVVMSMIALNLVARPRVFHALPVNFLSQLPPLIVGIYMQGEYSAIDYACVMIIALVALAVLTHEVWVTEKLSRQHFLHALELVRAEARIGDLMTATKIILQAALPPELLNLETMTLVETDRQSNRASVAICEIYDFAQWSTGLLVTSVVVVLHGLLEHFEMAGDDHGVVWAMSYGDSYVVCVGLLAECIDHEARAAAWATEACNVSASVWAQGVMLHGSVCIGPLQGKLSGHQSLRFVLGGAAFDSAVAALPAAPPGAVVRGDAANSGEIDGAFTSNAAQSASSFAQRTHPTHSSAPPAAKARPHTGGYSVVTLLFANEETQRSMVAFLADAEEGAARFTAVTPIAVLGSLLAMLLLELGTPRRTTHPVPYVGLVAGIAICGLAVVARRNATVYAKAPNLDYALRLVGLAVGIGSLFLTRGIWAAPHLYVGIYGATSMFTRLPWMAQLALQSAVLVIPTILYTTLGFFNVVSTWTAVVAVLVVIVVFARYTWTRAMCDQYAAALLAQEAVTAAIIRSEHHDALLAGLLPPHAIAIAKGRIEAGVEQGYVNKWTDLSVLQVATRGAVDVPAVLAAVNSDGLLEVVQTMGDTYLIAGPFKIGAGDRSKHAAAQCVVKLLRALRERCDASNSGFSAVATAGSAYGALLGPGGLIFRLFGAAVRENIALFAAAPQLGTCSGGAACVAFCTDGFCRQHANFVRVATRFDADQGMSVALGGQSAVLTTFGASDSAMRSATMQVAADIAASTFSVPVLWRVRGVGVASVQTVSL
jgi:hypothetical protein